MRLRGRRCDGGFRLRSGLRFLLHFTREHDARWRIGAHGRRTIERIDVHIDELRPHEEQCVAENEQERNCSHRFAPPQRGQLRWIPACAGMTNYYFDELRASTNDSFFPAPQ